MKSNYPWEGNVQCVLNMKKKMNATIAFRLPGWANGTVAPGGLYSFVDNVTEKPQLLVNGQPVTYQVQDGYVIINKDWKDNDLIEYKLPMNIQKVVARNELKVNNDRVAFQRGPLVYCIEGADNNGKAWNVIVPNQLQFTKEEFSILDEKVISLVANLPTLQISLDGSSVSNQIQKVRAIPYYAWCNRGSNAMQIWLPTNFKDVKVNY